MPLIGNDISPAFESVPTRQEFSGDGSTTTFTLNQTVSSEQDIVVSVDGVVQEPTGAYTVPDGTTLTFTAAPSNNSGNNVGSIYEPGLDRDFTLALQNILENQTNLQLIQTNGDLLYEGEIIEIIQAARNEKDAIIINAGGYTHTSIAILDSLRAFTGLIYEVHISNIYNREYYRRKSYISLISNGVICGLGILGYEIAIDAISLK